MRYLLFALLLSSCSGPANVMNAPGRDGAHGWLMVECHRKSECLQAMGDECPDGWVTKEDRERFVYFLCKRKHDPDND